MRLQQSGTALSSEVVLTLVGDDEVRMKRLLNLLREQITLFEDRFSRFKRTSELTNVNHLAGKVTEISDEMHDLLQACVEFCQQTEGLYSPFTLPALQQAGYKGSWPSPDVVKKGLDFSARSSAHNITELNLQKNTVTIPKDSALDFGGIGKGYLLEQLAKTLDEAKLTGYWLSLGGDIVCNGFDQDEQPWRIGIASAKNSLLEVASYTNKRGEKMAVATSGTTKRRGPNWHHIINPTTGQPAQTDVLTATVLGKSGASADVLAKCLVILGSIEAVVFANQYKLAGLVLQTNQDGRVITKGLVA